MFTAYIPAWRRAPFIRLVLPLILGIIVQWYLQPPVQIAWAVFAISTFVLALSFLFSHYSRYRLSVAYGVAVSIIVLAVGSLVTWYKDIRHNINWYGRHYRTGELVVATLHEQPVAKLNSYKTLATVTALEMNNQFHSTNGKLIVYFSKDSMLHLDYGSRIIFSRPLQEIKNAGNPGGFDYKRYSFFQHVTHQVYLKRGDFVVLEEKKQRLFTKILYAIKGKVLSILSAYIEGEKEKGLAEALLIGYKDDLDKNLVQSYTNTGVVHVIAISGLHLGLIYGLLLQLLKPFKKRKHFKWVIPVVVIPALWLFSLVAGGQPSVLRSALMFTCIVIAENFSRKPSIYNTLAVSAFILLCINPFWLWDVGFQLSYAAVLSIVTFMKPIYNWFYIKNGILDFIWKLNSVSLAAQVLTTPFSIYHFHQFPNYFLLTNFIAVPLSSVILMGEIFLCIISFVPLIASPAGQILSWLIWFMNSCIERIESLPYSLWDGMHVNTVQVAVLLAAVAGFAFWLLEKQKIGAWVGLFSLLSFGLLRSISFYYSNQQRRLIVYNIPRYRAIDLISGRKYFFIGDSDLLANDLVENFNLKPSRILYRAESTDHLPGLIYKEDVLQYERKRILLIDDDSNFDSSSQKIPVDLLVISKNPRLYILTLSKTFNIKQVVFDGSVPVWKLKYWEKDCDSLRIPYYRVTEKGAFVMNVN